MMFILFTILKPPNRYPDLFLVIQSIYSCFLFLCSYLIELYYMYNDKEKKD